MAHPRHNPWFGNPPGLSSCASLETGPERGTARHAATWYAPIPGCRAHSSDTPQHLWASSPEKTKLPSPPETLLPVLREMIRQYTGTPCRASAATRRSDPFTPLCGSNPLDKWSIYVTRNRLSGHKRRLSRLGFPRQACFHVLPHMSGTTFFPRRPPSLP